MKDTMENKQFKGYVVDKLINTKTGEVEVREGYNVVVNSVSKLIAALIKGHTGINGATYWAVGSGLSSWDDSNPPLPSETDSALQTETYRKAIASTDIKFLDTEGVVTSTVTNKIQITIEFGESEANGALREFGIYGGNATSTKDSGIMINHKIHPMIYKTNTMVLQRTLQLTF